MKKSTIVVSLIFLTVSTILKSTCECRRHDISKRNACERLNNHETGFLQGDQIAKLRERDIKELSRKQSVSSKKQQQINKNSKRLRRAIDAEIQNTTGHIKCEVPSLSCRHCCNHSSNCIHKNKLCRCDSLCSFYNDCCVDYELFCGRKQHHSLGVDKERLSCTKLPKNIDLKSRFERLWMVNKCPNSMDKISQKCQIADQLVLNITNIRELIPVTGRNGLVFRNEFCAKCNGVEDFEYFGFEMRCHVVAPSSISSFHELAEFSSKYCFANSLSIFRKVNQAIRKCSQDFQNVCLTMKELNRTCSKVPFLEEDNCISKVYLCNSNQSQLENEVDNECLRSKGFFPLDPPIPSFTVALRLSQDHVPQMQVLQCPSNDQFYDPYLQTCRYGQAISPPFKQNLDKFNIVVWFDANGLPKYLLPNLNQTMSSLAQLFQFKRSQVSELQEIGNDPTEQYAYRMIGFQIQLTNEQSLSLGKPHHTADSMSHLKNVTKILSTVLPLYRLLYFSGKFNMTISNQIFTVFKTTSRQLACIRKKVYPKGGYTSHQNGEYYYINSTGETLARNQVFFEDERNESISVCKQVIFSTCIGRRINLTSEEYVRFDNLSIFYNRTKTIFDFGEYDIKDGNIFTCISERKIIHWIPTDSVTAETYLTLICLALSLASLFLVIQTYVIFRELRNLPGKNILSLSISLFLVQLLWLIPDQWYSSTLCQMIAVVKHYVFLVSFVAMAIIAWDTHSVFGSKNARNKDSSTKNYEKKKFYKYSAIAWGLPAMFVAVCTAVDQKNMYAVYVNELLCWFDNVQAQKYLFVLPVGLLLLFNVILFALTVFRIQRIRFTTRLVCSDRRHKKMFWVYLKLSALMGFCWLFGFIELLVEVRVFSYLFVIFASLQGVYIALAFIVKKKTWEMYKKLLRIGQNKYKADYHCTLIEDLSHSKETRV